MKAVHLHRTECMAILRARPISQGSATTCSKQSQSSRPVSEDGFFRETRLASVGAGRPTHKHCL